MKCKNLLAVPALLALGLASTSQAANSINKNGSLLVTLLNSDSFVGITTELGVCVDGSDLTIVDSFQVTGTDSESFCDVKHLRVAGLSGDNDLAIGGLPGLGFKIPGTLDIRGGADDDTVIFGNDVSVGKLVITLRGGR